MKTTSPSKALELYAKFINKPLLDCNVFFPEIKEKAFSYIKFRRRKFNISRFATQSLFKVDVRGFNTNIYFAVNRENRSYLFNKLLPSTIRKSKHKIYVDILPPSSGLINWLKNESHLDLIDAFSFSNRESLQVYTTGITLITESIENIDALLTKIVTLANALPFFVDAYDFSKLPSEFKSLLPLMKKWGLSDDLERTEKLQRMSLLTKKRVVNLVMPYMSKINTYLSSFGNSALPDDAIILGRLAETVSEILAVTERPH